MKTLMTLGIVVKGEEILLGEKTEGFGIGKLNGPGGKFDYTIDKSIEDTLSRECREEVGITVMEKKKLGIIDFQFVGKNWELEVHFYKISGFWGEPITMLDADIKDPRMYKLNRLPYERMWAADRVWLPLLLADRYFRGSVLYRNPDTILKHSIREVQSLEV